MAAAWVQQKAPWFHTSWKTHGKSRAKNYHLEGAPGKTQQLQFAFYCGLTEDAAEDDGAGTVGTNRTPVLAQRRILPHCHAMFVGTTPPAPQKAAEVEPPRQ